MEVAEPEAPVQSLAQSLEYSATQSPASVKRVCQLCFQGSSDGCPTYILSTSAVHRFLDERAMPTPFLYAYLSTLRQKMDVFFVCSNCDSWVRRQTAIGASSDTLAGIGSATKKSLEPPCVAETTSPNEVVQVDPSLLVKIEEPSTLITDKISELPLVQATEITQISRVGLEPAFKTAPMPRSKPRSKAQPRLQNGASHREGSAVHPVVVKKNKTLLAVDRLILSVMLPGSYAPPEMRITQRLISTIRKDEGNNWLATICPPLVRRVLIDNDIRLESRKVLKSICVATWKSGRLQEVLGNATFAKNIRCSQNTV